MKAYFGTSRANFEDHMLPNNFRIGLPWLLKFEFNVLYHLCSVIISVEFFENSRCIPRVVY